MSRRLAAYAVCVQQDRVLLARCASRWECQVWTLPGGGVEQGEDPYDAVIRELGEETGCDGVVDRLLGVDSRIVPAEDRGLSEPDHQNVGVFYAVRITGGALRPEPNGDAIVSVWTPIAEVAGLRRSSLVDIGIALVQTTPASGHAEHVPVGGLIRH